MAKLTKSRPGARICDPACGSGSLLIKAGQEVGNNNFSLYGQEVNGSTWALAMMNMFLHGFDDAVIRWGDTLRNPKLKENDKLMKFDTVVANPPFSLDKWGAEEAADDPFNRFWRGIPPKSKGDWAFISHMIEVAQEGSGKVGVVIPHGVLFRAASEAKIRKHVVDENLLEAVIGLPSNLFFGTGIPAAIAISIRARIPTTCCSSTPAGSMKTERTRTSCVRKTLTTLFRSTASLLRESSPRCGRRQICLCGHPCRYPGKRLQPQHSALCRHL